MELKNCLQCDNLFLYNNVAKCLCKDKHINRLKECPLIHPINNEYVVDLKNDTVTPSGKEYSRLCIHCDGAGKCSDMTCIMDVSKPKFKPSQSYLDMLKYEEAERKEQLEKENKVEHPGHYNKGIEVWDFVISHKLDFLEGNIVKYLSRYKHKNGIEDLYKCREYINKLIETKENENE